MPLPPPAASWPLHNLQRTLCHRRRHCLPAPHLTVVPSPPALPPARSYTLYCKHPVWSKVIGQKEVEAVTELELRNSASFRMEQVGACC